MTKIKFKTQHPKKDVKEDIHNPQFKDADIRSDQIQLPKTKPDHKTIKEIEQHYLDPRSAPKNKIIPPKLPPNYLTKNKIEPPKNKPTNKPTQEIEQHTLQPHYIPKNKIRPPKLPPNYITRNKIKPPKNKPTDKPINKIQQPTLEHHYTPKNKITPPKLQPNYTPKNKIIPLKPVDKNENVKPISKPNIHSNRKDQKSINYDQNFNLLLCEQKLEATTEYYTSKILPKLIKVPEIQVTQLNIRLIKDFIKKIDWNDIVKDWNIKYPKNQHSNYEIRLNPKQDCSRINPLYKHKIWLETIYTNKKLNLTDQLISEVCGVHLVTIQNWRKKHGIPAKNWTNGSWIDKRGYVKLYMPNGYLHPELVPQKGRNVRFEHEIVMENYLLKNPGLKWSKKYLIDGKYLKIECNVHHINFKKSDNRLKNLWLYENTKSHKKAERSLNECFRDLIKLNQIGFEDGKYYLNINFDCRKLSSSKINELLKPISINPYKDINLVKEEIKKINWKEISDNWIVKIRENQSSEKQISLDPYSNCSDENPLYLHKQWVEHLVQDENFNLTQRRLAKLCGVDRGVIYYWSKVKHNIDMENKKRGFGKHQHSEGRVWMRVPKRFENPTAKNNNGWMYEHRYVIELYLTEHPELQWSKKYLIDGKYLKPECIVHHINFDSMDNRLENLWICENRNEHLLIESSLLDLVDELLKSHLIFFRDGEYHLKS